MEEDEDNENNEDEENHDDMATSWMDILGTTDRSPTQAGACALAKLLSAHQPLSAVLQTSKSVPRYEGVPKTPPPRKFAVDRNLAGIQRKLEVGLCALTHSLET